MAKLLRPAVILGALIVASVTASVFYALFTPAWQVPDEPAHYNYVRFVAENRRFPILQAGDYPHAYLEQLKAQGFPPNLPIDPIRYEFHQPPLYYALAAGVYALFAGAGQPAQILALRLFSVLCGALLVLISYRSACTLWPRRPALALGASAFIAFLPMRLAMSAGINNDALAELLFGVVLLLLIRYLVGGAGVAPKGTQPHATHDNRRAGLPPTGFLALGVVLGLLLITKSSGYIAVPLAGAALLWGEMTRAQPGRRLLAGARALALVGAPALLLAAPWWLRNMAVYGGLDILGLGRHDAIVAGQLRSADWIAQVGLGPALAGFLRTTFQSFWGQFGWMGILLDSRLYAALRLFSGLTVLGVALAGWRFWRRRPRLAAGQWAALALLALTLLLTLASFIWYNLQFWQPQGRYLFRALLPIGLLAAAGWRALLTRGGSAVAAGALVLLALGLGSSGALAGDLPLLWLAVCGGLAAGFAGRALWLPAGWSAALTAVPYAALYALDFVCLFGFVAGH